MRARLSERIKYWNNILQRGYCEEHVVVDWEGSYEALVVVNGEEIMAIRKDASESLNNLIARGEDLIIPFHKKISDIVDVKFRRKSEISAPRLNRLSCAEVLVLYFKKEDGSESICCMYSQWSRLAKIVRSMWQSSIISGTLLLNLGRTALSDAREYYDETMLSFRLVNDKNEFIQILNEFAAECKADLTLKYQCIESADIYMFIHATCQRCLFRPEVTTILFYNDDSPLWSSVRDLDLDFVIGDVGSATSPREERALVELTQRFKIYEEALNLLVSLLFGCDAIQLKQRLVEGPTPLQLSSWMQILTADVASILTNNLSVLSRPATAEVESELSKSLIDASDSGGITTGMSSIIIASSLNLGGSTALKSSIRRNRRNQSSNQSSSSQSLEIRIRNQLKFSGFNSPEIIKARQSIIDLQVVSLFMISELADFFSSRDNLLGTVGDYMIRQGNWEAFLEGVVDRFTVILGDLMIMDNVAKQLRNVEQEQEQELTQSLMNRRRNDQSSQSMNSSTLNTNFNVDESHHKFRPNDTNLPAELKILKRSDSPPIDPQYSDSLSVPRGSGYIPIRPSPRKQKKSKLTSMKTGTVTLNSVVNTSNSRDKIYVEHELRNRTKIDTEYSIESPEIYSDKRSFLQTQIRNFITLDLKENIVGVGYTLRHLCPLSRSIYSQSRDLSFKSITTDIDIASPAASTQAEISKTSATKDLQITENKKTLSSKTQASILVDDKDLTEDSKYQGKSVMQSKPMDSLLADFGSPRFGLSDGSWNLLSISSLNLEYIMGTLKLDIPETAEA